MSLLQRLRARTRGDDGLGIVTVVFVTAVVMAMTVTAVGVTTNNLSNVRSDRQSLTALAASEAGVAQAVAHLRSANLAAFTCVEPPAGSAPGATCQGAGPSWTSATNPMQVRIDGGTGGCVVSSDCFRVWIGTVQPFVPACPARRATPPGRCYGTYRIHSTGISGNGPGARRVAVDVRVAPLNYPLGVFSETNFSGNGNIGIHAESVYTGGCVWNRQRDDQNGSGFKFDWDMANNRPVLDKFTGLPAAAHAVGGVSDGNSCAGNGNSGPIHTSTAPCNPRYRFDRSGAGGPLSANDGCRGTFTTAEGQPYPTTSRFSEADMQAIGYRPRGLTDAQYSALKTQAQGTGTYNLAPGNLLSVLNGLVAAGIDSPVLYWDNGDVSLRQNDFPAAFSRALNETVGCVQKTLTIVVAGGNLRYQGGNTEPYLTAALFVPDGTLTGQGGRNTIGTVYAKTIDLGGNVDFHLDSCAANSPPGGVLDVEVTSFREDDGADFNTL